jgi:phospholipid-transporting ATPase
LLFSATVLWFLFLLAYGAFPVELSTDLHHILDTVGGSPSFWLTLVVVPITCVLPIFFFRAVKR